MDDDIVSRIRQQANAGYIDEHEVMLREAADEIERLRHELGMAHADLAMYIDRTAADEIERLRAEVEHYKTLYYKHAMEETRES